MKHLKLPEAFRSSLEASWKEGIPANMMLVLVDYYLIPFALFLGATPLEIGFLIAIPHLCGSLFQLIAVSAVRLAGSRLKLLITGAKIQGALFIPAALLVFLPFTGKVSILIFLMAIFRILANLIGTAWGSLISEYLPPELRGRFLGWRSRVAGLAGIFALLAAGCLLFLFRHISTGLGFFVLFTLIAAARFISASYFAKMQDLPYEEKPESRFTFVMFIRQFRSSNFVRFVLYVASITFATQLAAPYFSVHMLRNLGLNYLEYTTVHLASVLAGLVAFPIWGHIADRAGNARVLKVTSLLIPIIPLLWLAVRDFHYLIFIELAAGFVWGGFNLCTANFVFDAVTPQKRIRCLGYFNLINGVAVFLGASLGGFLAERLPPVLGFRLFTLFALSGLLRMAAHFLLARKFHEVRSPVERVSHLDLFFSVLGLRPLAGRNQE